MDILKIDKVFVSELDGTSRGAIVAKSVLRLAAALDLEVVAEGVETEEQLRELTLLGCTAAQGHYFTPAVTRTELLSILQSGQALVGT